MPTNRRRRNTRRPGSGTNLHYEQAAHLILGRTWFNGAQRDLGYGFDEFPFRDDAHRRQVGIGYFHVVSPRLLIPGDALERFLAGYPTDSVTRRNENAKV